MTDIPIEPAAAVGSPENTTEGERAFIEELAKQDKGRLAILRRNAGNSLAEARGIAWFHGLLGRFSNQWNEEAYFMIATLFASDKDAIKDAIDGKNNSGGNFGATLFALKKAKCKTEAAQKTFDRRFNILLDADFDPADGGELAYRLRQMTKRVIAEKDSSVRINWPQLLHDVKFWNNEKKYTQKSWARRYYAPALLQLENLDAEPSE